MPNRRASDVLLAQPKTQNVNFDFKVKKNYEIFSAELLLAGTLKRFFKLVYIYLQLHRADFKKFCNSYILTTDKKIDREIEHGH